MLLDFIAYSLLFMGSLSFCSGQAPKSVPNRKGCTTPPEQRIPSKLSQAELQLLYSEKTPPAVRQQILDKNKGE